ncbi:MAG: diacylglycerol kinase family protein [Pyrinomonadaceae bacterium]
MSKPLIIVNPSSASGATGRAWPGIASDLAAQLGGFDVEFTTQAGAAKRLAVAAAERGVELIVACGGDGTINEVANGILGSGKDSELGIIPSGTGGDFRRTLKIPTRPIDAAAILRDGKTVRIDVGRAEFVDHAGETVSRYFLGMASFGLSGEVISRAKRERSAWVPALNDGAGNKIAYARAAFEAVLAQTAVEALVQIDDGREKRLRLTNLCIANARYFGGGMKIAPDAKLTDGRFDVVTIGDLGAARIFRNAHKLFRGTHLNLRDVHHTLGANVSARPVDKGILIALEVDGELPGHLPAKLAIVPRALRIRVPK